MSTTSPSPFPTNGLRTLSPREAMQRLKANSCTLPQTSGQVHGRGLIMRVREMLLGISFGLSFLLPVALLSGCFEEEKEGVSYVGVNHTSEGVVDVTINGTGGIMAAYPHGTSGDVCCVTVPNRWKPGISVTIAWEDGGRLLLDDQGKEVIRNGHTVLVRGQRKTKVVSVPQYDVPQILWIHFFPSDEIKLVMSKYGPGYSKHGLPDPYIPKPAN
jgi:hypothetical protein